MSDGFDLGVALKSPIFAEFDPEALRLIGFSVTAINKSRGAFLYRKGEVATGAFIILNGRVCLAREERSEQLDEIVFAGTLLAELAMIAPVEHRAYARALDPCRVIEIPRTLIHRVFVEFPRTASRVRRYFELRMLEFSRELDALRMHSQDAASW